MRACRVDSQLPKFKNIFDVGFSSHVIFEQKIPKYFLALFALNSQLE